MHGCCGYLGQDGTDGTVLPSDVFVGPSVPTDLNTATVSDLSDPTVATNWAAILQAAGTDATSILRQVQLGQIASNATLSTLPGIQAAIVSAQGSPTLATTLASLTSNPMALLLGAVGLYLLLRRK